MEKINIAELLKDCPKGMELYSPLCGKCVFDRLNFGTIICKKQNTQEITFTSKGYYMLPVFDDCECMIFPSKDQRDWSKFQRPFMDGDVVVGENRACSYITIFRKFRDDTTFSHHACLTSFGKFKVDDFSDIANLRLATQEEKTKLFDAIKDNGYKWNPETKTLEKLIEPKFKVGDEIVKRNSISNSWIVSSVSSEYYGLKSSNGIEGIGVLSVSEQDNYEILPKTDKFDVTNFEPFMKVLVRSDNSDVWECDFFSSYNPKCSNRFHCLGAWYNICIPYIGNEHLRGTTDDCDEYYKNW